PKGKAKKHLYCVIDFEKGQPLSSINALSKCFLSLAEISHLQVAWVYRTLNDLPKLKNATNL
ncbi:hypothetical protein, partial [Catenovulum agarivorans]|uniref:hypothetical protein n=1 Tax=Catenovulum agarivorans TaxID=1172192 RepID=UPI001ED91D3D